jgi:hypothetical protein
MNSPLRFATWVIPLSYAVAAVAAGMIFPRLEIGISHGLTSTVSIPAAMAIYSSVASGMMALTGVVFSMAFVMISELRPCLWDVENGSSEAGEEQPSVHGSSPGQCDPTRGSCSFNAS